MCGPMWASAPTMESGKFPFLTVGGAMPTSPREQRKRSCILEYQRQRRSSRDDTKLRPRPTKNPTCRPERKSRNHPVSGASLGTFCASRKCPAGG